MHGQTTLSAAERRRLRLRQSESESKDIERWRYDPVVFGEECFGLTAWEKQSKLLRAVARKHRVACRSGHKTGKSNACAVLAFWWAICYVGAKVIMTSSSFRQVRDILWAEITALAARARRIGRLNLPEVARSPETGVRWDDGRFIKGFSTRDTEKMGGFSGPAMLFIVDEASGVDKQIYEAIRGNLAGGSADDPSAIAKMLLVGNPTEVSGDFYDAFHKSQALWDLHHVSSADTPNVAANRIVIPGLATQDYLDECLKAWNGVDDPRFQVRCLGNFPQQNALSVIKLGTVETAVERWRDEQARAKACEYGRHRLHLGVDVARFGDDDSVVAGRRGRFIVGLERCHGLDEFQIVSMVKHVCFGEGGLHQKGEPRPLVKVDVIGVGGGVATALRYAKGPDGAPLFEVVEVNVAEKAVDEDAYPNQRSEMWFTTSKWLETGAIPGDDHLHDELIAPQYKFEGDKRRVERKAEMKKRLGRSPDTADAVCLSIYTPHHSEGPGIQVPVVGPDLGYRFGADGVRGFGS